MNEMNVCNVVIKTLSVQLFTIYLPLRLIIYIYNKKKTKFLKKKKKKKKKKKNPECHSFYVYC